MAIKVVGAGLGRTGTHSLKLGLERLLGEPCYHMTEVFSNPHHVPEWHGAANGNMPNWDALFTGYAACVDWPASAFWPEISRAYPDALIILSKRDAESWWKSASATIFRAIPNGEATVGGDWFKMVNLLLTNRFTSDIQNRDACIAAFDRHNDEVLQNAPSGRLLVWEAKDGWEPICASLNLAVPDEPFPLTNTTEQFLSRLQ